MVDFNKLSAKEKRKHLRSQLEGDFPDLIPTDYKILSIIGSTEASDFGELCNGLRNIDMLPPKGDKSGWGAVFQQLRELQTQGYLNVETSGGRMQSFQLTSKGADAVRGYADTSRGILQEVDRRESEERISPFNKEDFFPTGKPF